MTVAGQMQIHAKYLHGQKFSIIKVQHYRILGETRMQSEHNSVGYSLEECKQDRVTLHLALLFVCALTDYV